MRAEGMTVAVEARVSRASIRRDGVWFAPISAIILSEKFSSLKLRLSICFGNIVGEAGLV